MRKSLSAKVTAATLSAAMLLSATGCGNQAAPEQAGDKATAETTEAAAEATTEGTEA